MPEKLQTTDCMCNCDRDIRVISSLDNSKAILYEQASELLPLIEEMSRVLDLTFFKVTAHFADSKSFPLANFHEGSLEMLLAKRFEELSDLKKKVAITNIKCKRRSLELLKEEKYSNLVNAGVFEKLTLEEPIFESATKLFTKIGESFKTRIVPGVVPPLESIVEHLHPDLDKIALRIHRIRCIDETNIESTSDSIALASVIVQPNGTTTQIAPVKIGDNIGDGREFNYGSWYYAIYDLWNPDKFQGFPKLCQCTFILSELDNGGLPEIVQTIYEKIQGAVVAAIGAAVGGTIGGAVGSLAGPIGAAVGAAVGVILGKLFQLFKEWWEDDLFPPVTVGAMITSFDGRWGGSTISPQFSCYFEALGGLYRIDYSWQFVK